MEFKKNILYVDDEMQNLIAFKAAFRKHYNIYTASSAIEGIGILKNNSIQAVITDQRMPQTTGVQFLHEIIPDYPYCIRMVLTGFSDIEAIIEAISTGHVFRYITKPWDDNELKMTIDGALKLYNTEDYNRNLLEQLKKKTIEQEEIIEERTAEIVKQNQFLEIKNIEIAQKNKDITDSINYAKRIQRATLPHRNDIWDTFHQSFVLFKPKDIVSGDFYFFSKNNDCSIIAVADCTGHGVPGAFMSMLGTEKLHDAVVQTRNPGEILQILNKGVKQSLHQSEDKGSTLDGMDIALCAYNKEMNLLEYAGANRNIWIITKEKNNELFEIKATKSAIGGYTPDEKEFEVHNINLNSGDTIYISSDGFADQFSPNHKKLMTKKFKEILISIQDKSMKEQKEFLNSFVDDWRGTAEQTDDILVIGIRI